MTTTMSPALEQPAHRYFPPGNGRYSYPHNIEERVELTDEPHPGNGFRNDPYGLSRISDEVS